MRATKAGQTEEHSPTYWNARPVRFSFDGATIEGRAGDTVASALIANGIHLMGRSFKYHRPRGAVTAADGLLLVDKDSGVTSHDVVAATRRLAATRKVGHAGTLDPMATGLLVLGVGRATRLLTYLVGADKT